MRVGLLSGLSLAGMLLAGAARAETFCFAQAQSYYEQVFCEVKAVGKGRSLPNLNEFKRNDEIVQALLLKRPAARAGITLAMPEFGAQAHSPKQRQAKPGPPVPPSSQSPLDRCRFTAAGILCGEARFQPVGNRGNRSLRPGALDNSNIMGLPEYLGSPTDHIAVNRYLLRSYRIYINKMLDIGLGGATMTFGKFAFLFDDLQDKGVDIRDRFETMYRFLKKDKRQIGVSGATPANAGLSIADCAPLEKHIITCVRQGRNYLYLRNDT